MNENKWEMMCLFGTSTLQDYLEVIDDASCHGFEFKIENHRVYFRERVEE